MELFKVLEYDDIITRHDELFFTNFCLGYRTGSNTGNLSDQAMKKSAPLFKYLCSIFEPKNILCLGKQTFKYVYETLNHGKKVTKLEFFNNKYKGFLANHKGFKVECDNADTMIYPLAHCGTFGTMNRNRGLPVQPDPLYYQKQDWKKIRR